MITPLEIRQHNFGKSLRGYDPEEVRAYLTVLSQEFEQVLTDNKRLRQELDRSQGSLSSFQEMESILHRTLLQAEQSSKTTLDNARAEAELKLQAAEQQATAITSEAREQKARLEHDITDLTKRRAEILLQLNTLLHGQLERLRLFESHEMVTPGENIRLAAPSPMSLPPTPSQDQSFFEQALRDRNTDPDIVQQIARKL